ncbi:hypothetical protein SAMN02745216_00832 [Desulfatibacillum alkenivorans DSM 16219]|jgi:hypothetical protein|uniref:DUF4384 domain-containing protein n=1 Tax=Desulfatibacillum alkenivorans DSM 16219 TaxID=1121393 RepID=A0A1M6FIL9_9BACT|nr:DUF4384 domain-containing protein [Desulfatibacillum alkenivorans]SHI97561.1 hypothetical protein SAMN02745216_00832 [Desulfatibacillum alkenivorans DSM 16219]
MPTTPNTPPVISWDDLFDQATEDASIHLWAAQSWLAPPSGYTQGYVLSLALCHRARSCAAQRRIKERAPANYAGYGAVLDGMIDEAKSALAQSLENDRDAMQAVLNGEVGAMARSLEKFLEQVLRLEEDARLFEDHPDLALEVREAAHEFVVRFAMMDRVREELGGALFRGLESAELVERLSRIGERFRESIGCFHMIRDLWPAFREREYNEALAWMETSPSGAEAGDEALDEPLMNGFRRLMESKDEELDAQRTEQAVALGLGELDPAEEDAIIETLALDCAAMDLAHDVRTSAREAMAQDAAPAVLPALEKALRLAPEKRSWLEALQTGLASFFTPKLAAAAAAACLALFVFLAIPNNDADQPVSRDAELAAVSSRPSILPTGSLAVLARKNDSQLNRVSALGPAGPDVFTMEPGWKLESGDALKVKASVDRDAYVHVIHIGPGKVASELYSGRLKAGDVLELPNEDWFVLDKKVGLENIILVSGHEPQGDLQSALAGISSPEDAERVFKGRHVQVFDFKHL